MAHPDENTSVYELKAYVMNIFTRLGLNFGNVVFGNLSNDIYSVAVSVHTVAASYWLRLVSSARRFRKHSISTTKCIMPKSIGMS